MVSQTLEVARVCSEAVVSSAVVFSYPYIVLTLGLEFKVSLLSEFLGALFLYVPAAIAVVVGIVLTILEGRERFRWLPSAAAFGFGLLLFGLLTVPVAIGSLLGRIWLKRYPDTYERYRFTLAAALVAGDALVSGVLVTLLAALRVLSLSPRACHKSSSQTEEP
jgi:uncharacterized oligopeptide transporter (OPT) family protein